MLGSRILAGVMLAAAAASLTPLVTPASAGAAELAPGTVAYRTVDGVTLRADVYRPPQGHGPFPAVVLVHGGGWYSGDRAEMARLGLTLAAAGFVAVAIDYRLQSARPYPDQVDDVVRGVRWVQRDARRLDVDRDRLGILGASAGGNLAALAATRLPPHTLSAVVSWSGIYDFPELLARRRAAPCDGTCVLAVAAGEYLDRDHRPSLVEARRASPAAAVRRSDPPMFLVTSRSEFVPLEQTRTMARSLATHGVFHRVMVLAGSRHALAYFADAMGPSTTFLRRNLGG